MKDALEVNTVAFRSAPRLFHKFQDPPLRAGDAALSAAFKMVPVEMLNYWIPQENRRSLMKKLLEGRKVDSAPLGSLLQNAARFQDLIQQIQVATVGLGVSIALQACALRLAPNKWRAEASVFQSRSPRLDPRVFSTSRPPSSRSPYQRLS